MYQGLSSTISIVCCFSFECRNPRVSTKILWQTLSEWPFLDPMAVLPWPSVDPWGKSPVANAGSSTTGPNRKYQHNSTCYSTVWWLTDSFEGWYTILPPNRHASRRNIWWPKNLTENAGRKLEPFWISSQIQTVRRWVCWCFESPSISWLMMSLVERQKGRFGVPFAIMYSLVVKNAWGFGIPSINQPTSRNT